MTEPGGTSAGLFLARSPRGAIKMIQAGDAELAAIEAAKEWPRASFILVHELRTPERFVPQTELKVTGVARG